MKYAYILTGETKYQDKKIYGVYSSFDKATNDALDLIEQNHGSKDYAMEHKMEHRQANC